MYYGLTKVFCWLSRHKTSLLSLLEIVLKTFLLSDPPVVFLGTLLSHQRTFLTVLVKEVVYERHENNNGLTEGIVTRVHKFYVPPSMSCCNRLQLDKDYLFMGNFNFRMPVSRGCQDIYEYSKDENGQAFYFLTNGTLSEGFRFCR